MTHDFDPQTRRAVLAHMNTDHAADNVLIARAFGPDPAVATAEMTGFDGDAGEWSVGVEGGALRVPWLGGAITERQEVRREIVALYDEACRRLGVTPRPH
ncbi:DUF2470 domain-containing protein [Microbacterium testaceum]|uniref:DUF2470 domain-containing protein n=1 Tax=Microbacterium testaceum TaxID=2033 RepID=UPI001D176731|nr:DUF2470 domain-containing protein [Microbacterium testaceum]MCC4247536.1 DUF2470 domain-containing protein [Microbacterium testaceum]